MNVLLILSALFAALTGAMGGVRASDLRQVEAVAAVTVQTAQIAAPARASARVMPSTAYRVERQTPVIAVPATQLRAVAAIRGERRRE